MSLQQKVLRGLSWAMVDKFFTQAIQFGLGIILARLLSPKEFGLIGMMAIFIGISHAFVISGFSEALIRKNDATEKDYSTVFIYNLFISSLCYGVLYLLSYQISVFFEEPVLEDLIDVVSLVVILSSIGVVSRARLIKSLDFKSLAKASVISTVLGGTTGIVLAFQGYGVWSLVWKQIVENLVRSLLFNVYAKSWFTFGFSYQSFRELFSFGSNLLVSDVINKTFDNLYRIVIGKFFSAASLGLFVKADAYKKLPSETIGKTIQIVSYPALSKLKDDQPRLKNAYQRLIKITMFITFVLMFILVASSEDFIIGLIGSKWKEAVPFLQLLCFEGMIYPLNQLNLNMLKVKGRSDVFLRLSLIVKLITVPVVIIGIYFGIKMLIVGMIVSAFISYYLASFYSGRMIGYPIKDQITDIIPSLLLGASIGVLVFFTGQFLALPHLLSLIVKGVVGLTAAVLLSELFSIKTYLDMRGLLFMELSKHKLFAKLF